MRKLIYLSALILTFTLFSCETDVDVNGEWEDITIVYGLLNPKDSVQSIRVQRAYLGDGDVLQMAAISDSIYYNDSLNVVLQKWVGNQQVGADIPLTPVYVNKEDGDFATEGHYVYQTSSTNPVELDVDTDGVEYKLVINNIDKDKEIKSSTGIVKDFVITGPFSPMINFNSTSKLEITWDTPENGKVYLPVIRFNYHEDGEPKYIDWFLNSKTSSTTNGGAELNVKTERSNFYSFLAENIEPSETKVRLVDSLALDFYVYAGAEEYHLYQQINGPSNSVVQEKPEFTNIENGIGIFSSRNYAKMSRAINPATLDEIVFGDITCGLHFGKIEVLGTNEIDTVFCNN